MYCYEIMSKQILESLSFASVCIFWRLFVSHVWNRQFRHFSIISHSSINSLLLHIHVNTIDILIIMCTLVATCVILERSKCTRVSTNSEDVCNLPIVDTKKYDIYIYIYSPKLVWYKNPLHFEILHCISTNLLVDQQV